MRTPDAAALLTGGLSLSYSIGAPDGESRALVVRDSADLEDEEPRQALLSWEAVHEVVDGTDAAMQIGKQRQSRQFRLLARWQGMKNAS